MFIALPAAAVLIFISSAAIAGSLTNTKSPSVTKGEGSIEYQFERYGDGDNAALNNRQSHKVEMDYGMTDRFEVSVEYSLRRVSPEETTSNGVGLEGKYMTTKQADNSWWLTTAVQSEYVKAIHDKDADSLNMGFLASRKEGKTQVIGNIFGKYEFGANRDGGLGMSSVVQVTHELDPRFAPGIEWQADYGALNDFDATDRQEQYLGPVARGKFSDVGPGRISYFTGYYRGLTDSSAANATLLKLEYEQRF